MVVTVTSGIIGTTAIMGTTIAAIATTEEFTVPDRWPGTELPCSRAAAT